MAQASDLTDVETPGLTLGAAVRSLRLFSLPLSVGTALVGAAAAAGRAWDWALLAATVAGVAGLHLTGNLLNDYFDYRSSVDNDVHGPDDADRPGRLLVRGQLRPRDVLVQAMVCAAVACLAGAYLFTVRGAGILGFAAFGAFAAYAYTGPPFRLKNRALGEALMLPTFGPVLAIGAAYVQTGRWSSQAAWAGLAAGLATTCVLVGNNLRDRDEDARAGIVTLATVAGGRVAQAAYVSLAAAAVALPAARAAMGVAPRLLLAAPLLGVLMAGALRAVWQGRRVADIDVRTARFATALLALHLAAYLLGAG